MRQHEFLDQDNMVARKPQLHLVQLPTSRCRVRPGQLISMYCGQDDVVCCTVCIAEDHRSCEGVIYIPRKAKDIQTSQEFRDVNAVIDTMKTDMESLKKNKQLDLNRIAAQHHFIQVTIGEIRDQLNTHLDDLEEKTRDELEKTFKIHIDQINDDFLKLENQLSVLEDIADKLKNVKNESQLFVDIKMAKTNQKDGKKIYIDIEKSVGMPAIHLVPNKEILNVFKQKYMGTIEDTKHFDSVVHQDEIDIKTNSDTQTCAIFSSCQMLDGNILLTDIENEKLKLMDISYNVIDECKLPGRPQNVCKTSLTEVAITLSEAKHVQFAEVTDKITLKGSFSVGDRCRGIAFNEGLLYLSCGGLKDKGEGQAQVQVYDMSGKHLTSYIKDKNNKKLFSLPLDIIVSERRTKLHIADRDNGVVTMNLDGTESWKFTHPDIESPRNMCVVNNDNIIVCGFHSHNVMLFNKNGQQKAVLLRKKDGIIGPLSVLYDRPNSRLIVSMLNFNTIRVYKLL